MLVWTNLVKLIPTPKFSRGVPIEDTHQFIEELEKAGEIKRVKTEVDTNLSGNIGVVQLPERKEEK